MQKKVNWKEFTSIEELQATLLSAIEHQAMAAIKKTGSFKVILAGGTTPEKIYQLGDREPIQMLEQEKEKL